MHSDKAYLRRIFQMPQPNEVLQKDLHMAYRQLLEALPADKHALVLTLVEKQQQLQRDCCVRSYIQGYELMIEGKWKSK